MNRLLRISISLLFICSGITSLVYETLWIRVLSLGIGSTSSSMSMVLSIFFFGLSLGSYFSGKWVGKIKNPLRLYGLIEGFIGIYSLVLIYCLLNFGKILAFLPVGSSFSWLAFSVKFLLVFIFLILPTTCMGATLPLLVKILSSQKFGVGKNVGFLYTINTLGAVIGAFITGYLLIPGMGVLWSNHLMVVVNLIILGCCWWMGGTMPVAAASSEAVEAKPSYRTNSGLSSSSILIACGFIGFSSIGTEVIWSKYLGIFFGTNIFGLSLILSIFLFGIAAGSYVLSLFIDRVADKKRLFLVLIAASVAAMVLSSQLLNLVPIAANVIAYYVGVNFLAIKSLLAAFVLIAPTSLFGALLPLAINLLTDSNENAPAVTGKAYAINTWGAILGSACSGLWMIPQLGSGDTLRLLLLLMVVTFTLVAIDGTKKKSRLALGLLGSVALTVFAAATPTISFKNIVRSAAYTYVAPNSSFQQVMAYFTKDYEDIAFLYEGKTAVISLHHESDGERGGSLSRFRLKTNGLNESYYDLENLEQLPKFEGLLGILPYAFHPDPRSVFVVGYGGGFTVDLLSDLRLERVHVAELETGILRAADFIHRQKNPILKRQNVDLEIEDARFVLNSGRSGPYDLMVSQPSHSWLSGVANLFTREFFEIVRSNLKPGGIYSQWLNLYNMDEDSLKSILKTFYTVFEHGAVFTDRTEGELIMLGSMSPLKLNVAKIEELSALEKWQGRLAEIPFSSKYDLISNYLMSRETALRATENSPLNTDLNAHAEVRQSSRFYSSLSQRETVQPFLIELFDGEIFRFIEIPEAEKEGFLFAFLKSLGSQQKYEKYFGLLKQYESLAAEDPRLALKLGDLCYDVERFACAQKHYKKAFQHRPSPLSFNNIAYTLIQMDRPEEALDWMKSRPGYQTEVSKCYEIEAYAKSKHAARFPEREIDRVRADLEAYRETCGDSILRSLGEILMRKGRYLEAKKPLEAHYDARHEDISSVSLLASIYYLTKDWEAARSYSSYFESLKWQESSRLNDLAEYYRKQGWEEDAAILEQKNRRISK